MQQYRSEFGVLYLNEQKSRIGTYLQGANCPSEALGRFRPCLLRDDSSLDRKSGFQQRILLALSASTLLQEDERYSFFSEDLIDSQKPSSGACQRSRHNGPAITADGSLWNRLRIVAQPERQGLAFLPLIDASEGEIILIKERSPIISDRRAFLNKITTTPCRFSLLIYKRKASLFYSHR